MSASDDPRTRVRDGRRLDPGRHRPAREHVALEARAVELERDVGRLDRQLADRAREGFVHGSDTVIELVVAAEGPDAAVARAGLVEAVQRRDTASLEEARASRLALEQAVALTDARRDELAALQDEQATLQVRLEEQRDAAEAEVTTPEPAAARQRRIDRGSQQGVHACPLDRHLTHFIGSWGFPRSGGRRHQGPTSWGRWVRPSTRSPTG